MKLKSSNTPTQEAKAIAMEAISRAVRFDQYLSGYGDYTPAQARAVRAALARLHDRIGNSIKGLDFRALS